jgi:hypothetical protein
VIENLSDIISLFPDGRGIFIAEKAFRENKRYCCGQPQLRSGKMIFSDEPEYFLGRVDFPSMVIDCKDFLNPPTNKVRE